MILQDLDAQLRELASADTSSSGVALISRGDEVCFEGAYGWASRTWGVPMRPDIRFDCASITKLFTAVATIQRVDAGDFSLDPSAIDYLGLTGTTISPKVTVRQLLTHSSGIARQHADEEDGERYEALSVDRPTYSVRGASGHLPNFAHKPPRFAPGEGARYNNAGFVLLGLMIEKATGIGYRDYVRAYRASGHDPLGLLRDGRGDAPEVAEPCEPITESDGTITGWRRNIYSYPRSARPTAPHVTAHDLVRFMDSAACQQAGVS